MVEIPQKLGLPIHQLHVEVGIEALEQGVGVLQDLHMGGWNPLCSKGGHERLGRPHVAGPRRGREDHHPSVGRISAHGVAPFLASAQ